MKKMSSNFFANFSPLLLAYVIFLTLTVVVKVLPDHFISRGLQRNFLGNGLLMLFLLTLQEECLYIFLQFANTDFNTSEGSFGFVLALACLFHVLAMFGYIIKSIHKKNKTSNNRVIFSKVEGAWSRLNYSTLIIYMLSKVIAAMAFVSAETNII